MTGWRLDPAGIQAVLNAVNGEAAGLGEFYGRRSAQADQHERVLAGLGSQAAVLVPVQAAVQAWLDAQVRSSQSVTDRIEAGVLGVLNATLAYNEGNREMAGVFQAEAARAAASGDFGFFEQYGVR